MEMVQFLRNFVDSFQVFQIKKAKPISNVAVRCPIEVKVEGVNLENVLAKWRAFKAKDRLLQVQEDPIDSMVDFKRLQSESPQIKRSRAA